MDFFRSNICFDLIPDFDLLGFWFAFVPAADLNGPNWIYLFLLKPIFLEKFGDNLWHFNRFPHFIGHFFMTCETNSERG